MTGSLEEFGWGHLTATQSSQVNQHQDGMAEEPRRGQSEQDAPQFKGSLCLKEKLHFDVVCSKTTQYFVFT